MRMSKWVWRLDARAHTADCLLANQLNYDRVELLLVELELSSLSR